MEIANLLTRCIALEHGAGEIYRTLEARAPDGELAALWAAMARDENEHARKLTAWRTLTVAEAPGRRTAADGFDEDVLGLEGLLSFQRERAARATTADDAFAIALALETSELDAIYTTLLQASPMARFPDVRETFRAESAGHHERLLAAIAARSRDEHNRLAAAVLAAAHDD